MGHDNDLRPRIPFKDRTKGLLDKYYAIAEEMTYRARDLVMSGEDIRSTKDRPGVSTLMHPASKAIDEIVRLTALYDTKEANKVADKRFIGWKQPDEDSDTVCDA